MNIPAKMDNEQSKLVTAIINAERPRPWRDQPMQDVPFNEIDIEQKPIGPDGHIKLP